jgi:hypothetical protein
LYKYDDLAEFVEYVRYTRNLHYEQDPDYNLLRRYFKKVMDDNCFENDLVFDWVKEKDIVSTNIPSNRNQVNVFIKNLM